jgi:hypothetical protein
MTENRPRPVEVTVHLADRNGNIKGTPLPVAKPGFLAEESLISQRAGEIPDFDQAEHDRIFQKRMVNGVPHWTQPHQMTAREILSTHRLESESSGLSRADIYGYKMMDILAPKYGQLTPQQRRFHAEDSAVNAVSRYGAGSGAGLEDSITSHGYDWNKPVLLSTLGPNYTDGRAFTDKPQVKNGMHRLMWMFTHHPDVPIPVQSDVRGHAFDGDHINTAMSMAVASNNPQDYGLVHKVEEQTDELKKKNWRNEMAQAYPEKYGSVGDA